ncbi:MAG TPA: hypothetical protein VE621_04205 [Bryobacteraceae bacterium]|nr:hypothetical protein [Bryobacteraceae bacterium]
MLSALCGRRDYNKKWTLVVGYRYQPSSRHFVGTVEQTERERLRNQIQNTYHLLDFMVSRQLTKRLSVSASLPVVFAYRNQLYVPRGEFQVNGIGDATVGVHSWLFRPPTESGGNIGLGVSLKMPTGRYNATGVALDRSNNQIIATADQSIQPGDGGTGFAVDLQAFHPIPLKSMVYFNALYLFNPRNTNGVSTFRSRRGEEVLSVTDQYLFRGGVSRAVPRAKNLFVTFGGRMEGVPVRDAFGGSDGFRRPGYAISIDPGFMYNRWGYTFTCNVPFAVERNRKKSVTDYANRVHGDAAFADYTVVIGLSKRF